MLEPTWQTDDGRVQLYLGDCLEILPQLPKVDAVVTDPPYGLNGSSGTINTSRAKAVYTEAFTDNLDAVRNIFVPAIVLCISMARSVVFTPGTPHAWEYPKPQAIGFLDQPASRGLCRWGAVTCQPVLFYGDDPRLGKKIGRLTFRGNSKIPDIDHPCPKPLSVTRWMVGRAALGGETVLDPFMGSGTTGIACIKLGRKFIGIEIEPKYFEIAKKRIQNELAQGDFFRDTGATDAT